MTIKGVIFDVDGVIVNTENTHFLAFREVLDKYNYPLSYESYKKHFSGKSIKGGLLSLLSEIKSTEMRTDEQFIVEFSHQKISATKAQFQKQIVYFEDTITFIQKISDGLISLRVGVVESKPILALTTGLEPVLLQYILDNHNLKKLFPVVVTADQYSRSKPDPECYKITLQKMNLNPEFVIGIEDSPPGIKALNNAAILSIGLTNTHSQVDLKEARYITEALTELIDKK